MGKSGGHGNREKRSEDKGNPQQSIELNRIASTGYLTIDPQNYVRSLAHNLQLLGEIFGKENFVEAKLGALDEVFVDIQHKAQASGLRLYF